jgi:hypothetical protein
VSLGIDAYSHTLARPVKVPAEITRPASGGPQCTSVGGGGSVGAASVAAGARDGSVMP